ncbi:hypothetical protein [Nocardioides sp. Kera G14]|uniref:hypothetical protein n=1 Tax=Nocardioides sp. Kera G14 TaxID=2884264 RepID=UPI001D11A7AF|nr:hypothetical protein [Nocardioides sp. Kera G14]UDY24640.1 hypothetical protein LH076_04860 [Nocardioides sp. Kera G14]
MSVLEIAGELYGLVPAEFIRARDAEAKRLKGTPEATVVKGLPKASTAAWAVNLLVRHATEEVEQMLAVGAALRAAQADLDAAQLRTLTTQRRQLTAAMTTRARALALEHGVRLTESVAEQVEQTLTAAMIDENAAAAVRSGLLLTALTSTGIEPVDVTRAVALSEAVGHHAAPAPAGLRAVKKPSGRRRADDAERAAAERKRAEQAERAERREAARQAVEQARREAEAARASQQEANRLVHERQAGVLQAHAELEELRRRVIEAEQAAKEAEDHLADAEEAQASADAAATEAEHTLDEALRLSKDLNS